MSHAGSSMSAPGTSNSKSGKRKAADLDDDEAGSAVGSRKSARLTASTTANNKGKKKASERDQDPDARTPGRSQVHTNPRTPQSTAIALRLLSDRLKVTPFTRKDLPKNISDDRKKAAANLDKINGGKKCLISRASAVVQCCHVLQRATDSAVLDCLEYAWCYPYESLHVDTRWNLVFMTVGWHKLYDNKAFMLVPTVADIQRIYDYYITNRAGNEPRAITELYPRDKEDLFEYTMVVFDSYNTSDGIAVLEDAIYFKNANNQHVFFPFPYATLGTVRCTALPYFAIYNCGTKLQAGGAAYTEAINAHLITERTVEMIKELYTLWTKAIPPEAWDEFEKTREEIYNRLDPLPSTDEEKDEEESKEDQGDKDFNPKRPNRGGPGSKASRRSKSSRRGNSQAGNSKASSSRAASKRGAGQGPVDNEGIVDSSKNDKAQPKVVVYKASQGKIVIVPSKASNNAASDIETDSSDEDAPRPLTDEQSEFLGSFDSVERTIQWVNSFEAAVLRPAKSIISLASAKSSYQTQSTKPSEPGSWDMDIIDNNDAPSPLALSLACFPADLPRKLSTMLLDAKGRPMPPEGTGRPSPSPKIASLDYIESESSMEGVIDFTSYNGGLV